MLNQDRNNKSFIVLGASPSWVYPIPMELGKTCLSLAIELTSFQLGSKASVNWPYEDPESLTKREIWRYPRGFNSKLNMIFKRMIRSRLSKKIRIIKDSTGEYPYVIIPYPWFLQYLPHKFDVKRVIYLNYDDYITDHYGINKIRAKQEKEIISQAGVVLCSSFYQTCVFKTRFPNRENNIFHFPHGVHSNFINPNSDFIKRPKNIVIVGNLSSRFHWQLIFEVISELRDIEFSFVGNIRTDGHLYGQKDDWLMWLNKTLRLKNINHIPGGIPYSKLPPYYWDSSVIWMPYDSDLSFVKASCPAKIGEGLASGRPIVSSDIPECRMYPEWIRIYKNANEAVEFISKAIKDSGNQEETTKRQLRQIEFAKDNTCSERIKRLLEIIDY